MAHGGRQAASQPARQKVTLKPDQKADREQDKSRGASSGDVWDYYVGQDLKARFVKRHSKAHQKPVCKPEEWDYDIDDTIPYVYDEDENPKTLVIKQTKVALEQLSSDSIPYDSISDLSCVQRDNDSNLKNECHLDIEVDPVPNRDLNPRSINHDFHNCVDNGSVHSMDDEIAKDINIERLNDHSNGVMDILDMEFINNLKPGDEFNGNTKHNAFHECINILNDDEVSDIDDFMKTSDSVSDDSSRDLSCIKHGNDSNVKNKCHLNTEVDPVSDPDINPSSINHDFHNSVGNANIQSMDDEIAMDINIEPPSDQSNGIMDALNMEFINNLKAGDEFNGNTNQDEFYEFINFMNDDENSDIDDLLNHNLQQGKLEH